MKLTRCRHSRVRVEQGGRVLVIDDGLVHRPGDALHVPDVPVETLLVPLQASWLKTAEAIAFMRETGPARSFGIHDGEINERALTSINGWLQEQPGRYTWLPAGAEAWARRASRCSRVAVQPVPVWVVRVRRCW